MLSTIVPEGLRFGVLFDRLNAVYSVYIRAEEAMASFRARNGLVCPPGCGTCCEGFIPDILPVEASYLAAWLVRTRPNQALDIALQGFPNEPNSQGCPLYDPDSPEAHCTVYPGRPLICRLFAFTGVREKNGTNAFALCRHMADRPASQTGQRAWRGRALEETLGLPPIMSDFASELDAAAPGDGGRRALLTEALPPAISQILFLAGLGDRGDPNSDGDNPIMPPLDNAS